jgi:nickel-dependent lactate racemase
LTDIRLPYGKSEIQLSVPDKRLLGVLKPRDLPGANDPYSAIVKALENPVDRRGLKRYARAGKTVVVVTDDYTRPTPAGEICIPLLDQLDSMGIDDSSVTILAAGGLHRPMTEDELEAKFGKTLLSRVRVLGHDAWNDGQLRYLGQTSRGTPIWINRAVTQADLRITVGMTTAHFIAGYAAGPKTILPGASGHRTIYHNHGIIATSRSARIGALHGNPCWEDMSEVTRLLDPVMSVNVVLNADGKLVEAFHGEPVSAQKAGLSLYHSIYDLEIPRRADIIVASANPMYNYMDQCLKTIVHSSMLVKDGGTRIVASPCEELLGPPFLRELYYHSLTPRWPSADEHVKTMRSGAIDDIADAVGILKFL